MMITWLKNLFDKTEDPVHSCDLYKDKEAGSCVHVAGHLCDYPYCDILVEYLDSKEKGNYIAIPFG